MEATPDEWRWALTVAAALLLPDLIALTGQVLQRTRVGSPVPEELQGIYDPGEYETSSRYTKAKIDLSLVQHTYDVAIFLAFWFLHGFPWLDSICVGLGLGGEAMTGLAYFGLLMLGSFILGLPFDVYGTFVLEERFGFNKTTPYTFVKDRLKGAALGVLLGAPLLYVVLWFFISAGPLAWLWVFVTITAFQLVLVFLMPALILPLFLEMDPLPEGTALVTNKMGRDYPDFLSGRFFYRDGEDGDGLPVWSTTDRRFQGAAQGAKLTVRRSGGQWALVDGETVYASLAQPSADPAAGGRLEWRLAEAGTEAAASRSAPEAGTASDPLVAPGLWTTSADVGSLRGKLLRLADRLGYHGASIFVIDGSSRSEHSNAFCTGFGRFRRICLFDTLLPLMSEDEIVAVLGHEIGHDRLFHVHTRLVFGIFYSFLMLYALGKFLTSRSIGSAFFVAHPSTYVGIVLFSCVWSIVDFVVNIPLTVQTRSNEFAADRYSVNADPSYGPLLSSALKKLMKKSKSNLTPHPFHAFLTYSHPPLDGRLQAIRAHHNKTHPQSPM